ncbi:MAG TPA: iron uptake transporter permease EfeU [Trebonia sp.]|nr:iron uptake transporter permease EfeU [Trebonia sp.]
MNWADSVPNLLIGLREGLEAGLVVTILLAAVKKIPRDDGKQASTAPIWLGVLGAVMLAGSFAAVLTYSTNILSSTGQEAVGGLLSVFAVGLVTWMIFWMRRTARTLSAHLKQEVARAAAIGAGALTITAFLSVGREGLETTLFLWTAARASGQTVAPLVGAAIGIAAAVLLCWGLYNRAVKLNIGVFFSRTAVFLIVIAAGVLAYGLGDLQDASLLPGHSWVAFDLSGHIDTGSWWVSIISGVTDLSPTMTVLQVTAWVVFLAVVLWNFLRAPAAAVAPVTEPAKATAAAGAGAATAAATAGGADEPAGPGGGAGGGADDPAGPGRWERLVGRRTWTVAGVLVVVPALAAGTTIAALPAASAAASTVTVTNTSCGDDFTSARAGSQTLTVTNNSSASGEVNLLNSSGGIVGEIETLGPATSAPLAVTLGSGTYTIACFMSGKAAMSSAPVTVSGSATTADPVAPAPVTVAELTPPNDKYQAYAAGVAVKLEADVTLIQGDLKRGDIARAKVDWLAAQLEWERIGASYDSFGQLGLNVDLLPTTLPRGVNDPGFIGLHRLEYGLWNGQGAAELLPVANQLAANVTAVRKSLTTDDLAGDPTQLPIRAHEILEDALRDHLSGIDDNGAGAAYPMTYADLQVDEVVVGYLGSLISTRQPGLLQTIQGEQAALAKALLATRSGSTWLPAAQVPLSKRQDVDSAIDVLLESLSSVPDLLEVRNP